MQKRKGKFPDEIYKYCDANVECEVLFPVFMNLYPENGTRNKTSLAKYTSKIINELVWAGILKEIPKNSDFCVPYGFYKILKHDPLIKEENNFKKYNFDFTKDEL